MMQVPVWPLVTPTGLPRSSGISCCSTDAKKAFISISAMNRGQGRFNEMSGMGHGIVSRPGSSDQAALNSPGDSGTYRRDGLPIAALTSAIIPPRHPAAAPAAIEPPIQYPKTRRRGCSIAVQIS